MSANDTTRSSSLLFDEQILVLRVRLATLLTLPKAIVFQQLRFCTYGKDKGNDRDILRDERGGVWIGRTVTEWRLSSFSFWCNDTIADTFAALVEEGYVLEGTFPEGGKGRTKWYRIADDALTRLDYLAMACHLQRPMPAARVGRRGERSAALAATPLPRDELFIDSETLFIIPRLAQEIGLNEAIVLQQVYYWLDDRRRPEVRDGERWIYNTYTDWREQFPFFSLRTVQRTFLSLEQKGLLKSSHFSRHPEAAGVDHTKWYTIDFATVRTLRTARGGRHNPGDASETTTIRTLAAAPTVAARANVPDLPMRTRQLSKMREQPEDATSPITNVPASRRNGANFPTPLAPDPRIERAIFPTTSLKETRKNIGETRQEQLRAKATFPDGVQMETPVVVPDQTVLSEWLFARGVTRKVAERLAREVPGVMVMRQVEVYDWLREADEDDERLTPGRLRRMIEEEWAPPLQFVPAAERTRREVVVREEEAARRREQDDAEEEARVRREAATAERRARLDALGLREEDQRVWASLVASPRRLPSLFADALFYPPHGAPDNTPAVVILADHTGRDLARSAAQVPARREIERRLLERYPALVPRVHDAVRYLAYDELLALRQTGNDSPTGSDGDRSLSPSGEPQTTPGT